MTEHTTHANASARAADRTGGEKLLADWREAVAKELEASDAAPGDADLQHAYKAAVEHSRQVARLAWTRILEPTDLRVRAEIVRHALWPTYHGERRFEEVLGGKEYGDGLELAEFDERAVAELVKAVLWTVKAAPARPEPVQPGRDWLAILRDAGPNGAAPDARHAVLWGAILDLRGCRDAIENTVEKMTEKLDRLADETTLTHAIAAGWEPEEGATAEPEENAPAEPESARAAPGNSERRIAFDLEDLVGRARDGVTALHSLWDSRCSSPEEFPDQKFAASLKFCIDGLDALLKQADRRIAAAIEGGRPPG
jgi:hypothetical protein